MSSDSSGTEICTPRPAPPQHPETGIRRNLAPCLLHPSPLTRVLSGPRTRPGPRPGTRVHSEFVILPSVRPELGIRWPPRDPRLGTRLQPPVGADEGRGVALQVVQTPPAEQAPRCCVATTHGAPGTAGRTGRGARRSKRLLPAAADRGCDILAHGLHVGPPGWPQVWQVRTRRSCTPT